MPWCTTPIEAESSLGPDSHHPIISLSGIPSAVIVLRILHPILVVVFYIESRRFLIRDSPRPATTYEQKTGGADGVKGA